MALESMDPYPTGSAEHAATYLTTRGLGCLHPVKYHVDGTNQVHSKYPSRLGFFHFTAEEPTISFLDTRKLCDACLDIVVPNGFNFWSAYSIVNGTSAAEQQAPKPQWLKLTPSSDTYPPLVQAGTEGFAHVSLAMKGHPIRSTASPVVLPIPEVPGAKEAWDWLQIERKPFYIDQLHLIKGWSLIVETRAKTDSLIAERAGIGYRSEAQPKIKDRKRNSSERGTVLLEKGVGSSATTPLKAKKKTKVANKKLSELPVTTELTGSVAEPSDVPLDQPDGVFESFKADQNEQHASLTPSTPSKAGKTSTKIKSTDKPSKKSSTTERSKTPEKGKMETTSVGSSSLGASKKVLQFAFTRNWGSHDLIPFDGPTVPLKLSDYKLQAQKTSRPVIDPESNYSLEKLMSARRSTEGKLSFADLVSRIEKPSTAAYLRAAGIEGSKTRASTSTSKEKGIRGVSPEGATTTKKTKGEHNMPFDDKAHKEQSTKNKPLMPNKTLAKQQPIDKGATTTKKTKGEHDMPFDDKAHKEQPTKDKPPMPKKTPAKQQPIENEPVPSIASKKDLKAPREQFKRDGPRGFEPAKPPKIRPPQQNKPPASLGFEHKPTPNFETTKPRYPTSESKIGKIGKKLVGMGNKLSFSHDTGHNKQSKPGSVESSNTETININNYYAEASFTQVSVNDTLYIDQDSGDESNGGNSSDDGSGSDGGGGSDGSDGSDGNDG
ncbi:hypothetical protein RRF57_002161 [Xylaria bambusicola]|uniref:Uncharacterized protein n=1 Tax=Xylaria bambusicola TaxID=326684 RepID=A0AAN7UIB5_9PEZI